LTVSYSVEAGTLMGSSRAYCLTSNNFLTVTIGHNGNENQEAGLAQISGPAPLVVRGDKPAQSVHDRAGRLDLGVSLVWRPRS
jgi:hypothetical protein